jgi:general secretion pathway protein N
MSARALGVPTLAALALALSALVALEVAEPDPPPPLMAAPPAPPVDAPTAEDAGVDPTWRATIVARPLFTPDRRPPPPAARATEAVAAKTVALPRLAGIALGPVERHALFQPSGEAKPLVRSEGEEVVAGWRVAAILPDQVMLIGPDGPRAVFPQAEADRGDAARPPPRGGLRPQVRIPPGPQAPKAAPAQPGRPTNAPGGSPPAASRIPAGTTNGGRQ